MIKQTERGESLNSPTHFNHNWTIQNFQPFCFSWIPTHPFHLDELAPFPTLEGRGIATYEKQLCGGSIVIAYFY